MKFIKDHKLLFIFLLIVLIFLIALFIMLKPFMMNSSLSEYGNRLDGIENVKVSDDKVNKLEKEIEKIEIVNGCNYVLKGRLINILIEFKEEATRDQSIEIGNKVLEYLDDDEKSYYDIQVLLKSEKKDIDGFSIIGYKHKTREALVWE